MTPAERRFLAWLSVALGRPKANEHDFRRQQIGLARFERYVTSGRPVMSRPQVWRLQS